MTKDVTLLAKDERGDLFVADRECGTGACLESLWLACDEPGKVRRVGELSTNNFPAKVGPGRRGGHPHIYVDFDQPSPEGLIGWERWVWVFEDGRYVRAPAATVLPGHADYALRRLPAGEEACNETWLERRGPHGRWTTWVEGALSVDHIVWSEDGLPAGLDTCAEHLEGVFAGKHHVRRTDPEYANSIRWEGDVVVVGDGTTEARFRYTEAALTPL